MTRSTLKLPKTEGSAVAAAPPAPRSMRTRRGAKPPRVAPAKHESAPAKDRRQPTARAAPAQLPTAADHLTPASTSTTMRASALSLVEQSPRLSKRMSELGLCSRREADEWIENGWVRVDGVVVSVLGSRVPPDAHIEIDAAARRQQSESVTILLHKPVGYVSGQAEDGYEPASVLIRPGNRWPEDALKRDFRPTHLRGLAPAGRLDIDSTGLIVFTQDGRVARRLIGHDSEVEKEYLVRVEGPLSADGLRLLNHGLELDGAKLKPARVSWQNEHQLRFVLREGKKRQIRRMAELVGISVTGLKRIRIGSVSLSKLPSGQWRYLRPDETF
ncbi:MAG: pseudouridine synthase [Betaproteobacteria bacterium]